MGSRNLKWVGSEQSHRQGGGPGSTALTPEKDVAAAE